MYTNTTEARLISINAAAKLAGMGEWTLRRWIRAALNDAESDLARCVIEIPGTPDLRVRRAAFTAWLDGQDLAGDRAAG